MNEDFGVRALLQSKVGGADCEGMCKKLGAYPNCQCPGFNGEPASSDDTRGCYTKYCQDPKSPCPNDAFVNCVKANTAAFLQQMKASTFGADCEGMCKKLGAYPNCQCPGFNGEPSSSDDTRACYVKYCQDPTAPCPNDAFVGCVKENTAAFLMQMKTTSFGVDCENMCKDLGAYPNCKCPGFNGEPASSDDTRACYTQYCQDPSAPCPNDAFTGCVKANTQAFLQWQNVFKRISFGFDSMLQVARLANSTKVATPNAKPYTAH